MALRHLLTDPIDRTRKLPVVALLISRAGTIIYAPSLDTSLQIDDVILFAGPESSRGRISLSAMNDDVLDYVRTGREGNGGLLWRAVRRHRMERNRRRRTAERRQT